MIIHKFGGGVLTNPQAVSKMADIVHGLERPTVIVVSAFNKMTNAFELLASAYYNNGDWETELSKIKQYHEDFAQGVLEDFEEKWPTILVPLFKELESFFTEEPKDSFDEIYDRIVGYGELLSSTLISICFQESGITHQMVDARELIITNNTFRDAGIVWEKTEERIKSLRKLADQKEMMILTQGFIGRANSGETVTLGREGSDFTAAIFGHCLEAEEVWIWKDVPGVMSADPKEFENTQKLDSISYLEAIEMAFFGAKVIHPKTIKPLQNKRIPLVVKDFEKPGNQGTLIHQGELSTEETPVFICKRDQVLITFQPRDFSFIVEEMISEIFAALHQFRIKVNLMQHAAISLTICVNNDTERVNELISALLPKFRILYNTGLELLTIRRYNDSLIESMTGERRILVQQLSRRTARFVLSND